MGWHGVGLGGVGWGGWDGLGQTDMELNGIERKEMGMECKMIQWSVFERE